MRALLLTCLLPCLAHAAPARLLILGGGAARADAEKALEAAAKAALPIAPVEGFPKIVESATVKGLKPGFHVVVAGACADGAGLRALEATRQLFEGAYFRPVEWPEPLPCPELAGHWTVKDVATATAKDGSSLAYVTVQGAGYAAFVEARRPDRTLLEVLPADVEKAKKVAEGGIAGAEVTGADARGEELVVKYEVYTPDCTTPATQHVEQRFSFKAGKPQSKWKLGKYERGQCD